MSILVTRPNPAGEALTQRLINAGKTAFQAPLIEITAGRELPLLDAKLKELRAGDCVFLLSKNAVSYANWQLNQLQQSWPDTLSYYGIGQSTAKDFQHLSSLPICYPEQGETSEDLLELPALNQVKNKRILLLRGNGGRDLLATTLSQRGAIVDECECYQRLFINYSPEDFALQWEKAQVDTLVVTSGEMLQQLFDLVAESKKAWLLNCHLLVVSERLATIAKTLGWETVTVAESANNDALFHALI
ncbi:uroporphyrinogen-III synthase [Proteus sp. GOKU]|uniref:uroporphyrinogen-III synthase n=1 Tax=Proteus TaxID=583 RepID=UPI001892BB70|nr:MULTISPECIES: uroporphyrinogen-III synthase [Proteus]QPB78053.1 uroporphyrinogen-III synthase [Proteus sp. GOKU]QQP24060.1 uroporphyrinogen-III synthase [Proteus vulgaris]